MSYDLNVNKLAEFKGKKLFLIDSSAFCKIEELTTISGINLLYLIKQSNKAHFLMTNEVCVELMNGPRVLKPDFLLDHIINTEGSGSYEYKENRFLIEEDRQTKYIVLNKVSWKDYNQVLLCQNHPELTLVSNDRKLLKSAATVLRKRVIGINKLMEEMIELEPTAKEYKRLYDVAKQVFQLKKVK